MRAFELDEFPLDRKPVVQRPRVEKSLDQLAWLMDDLFRIPVLGWRFGLDAVVGLIPGFGDTSSALFSFYILVSAVRYRVPKITLLRMALNIAIDYVAGSLPVVGDLVDAWWKANQRNVALLKERATVSADDARKGRLSDWLFVGGIIVGLAGLALASAFVSVYLMIQFTRLLTGSV
jgi:hypothetical protein